MDKNIHLIFILVKVKILFLLKSRMLMITLVNKTKKNALDNDAIW